MMPDDMTIQEVLRLFDISEAVHDALTSIYDVHKLEPDDRAIEEIFKSLQSIARHKHLLYRVAFAKALNSLDLDQQYDLRDAIFERTRQRLKSS